MELIRVFILTWVIACMCMRTGKLINNLIKDFEYISSICTKFRIICFMIVHEWK